MSVSTNRSSISGAASEVRRCCSRVGASLARDDQCEQAQSPSLDHELDPVLSTVPRDSFGPLIAEARKQAHKVLERAHVVGARIAGRHRLPGPRGRAGADRPRAGGPYAAGRGPGDACRYRRTAHARWSPLRARRHGGTQVDNHRPVPSEPMRWTVAPFTTVVSGNWERERKDLTQKIK